ncbi:MAG: beta-lactamase family protein [Bacteroidales bacterium]|nr:beta-lactamase family protein [Bacteroidales bacterium]
MKTLCKLIPLLLTMLALSACGDIEPGNVGNTPDNSAANMMRFSFPAGSNSGFDSTPSSVLANGFHFITVPESSDLTNLVPEIIASEGAAVYLDGEPYAPGKPHDFSGNTQSVKVVSADGSRTNTFRICVKKGNRFIDEKVYDFMNDFAVPGVSVSIMKGTEVVYSSGYGFAVVETDTRCTPDHLFRMASISKQFCTMCIMTLKEQGRLGLDDQVFGENGILKGIYHNITPYHEAITVRHLLSHSSGICKGLSDPAFTNSYRFYSGSRNPVPTDTLIQRTLDARQNPSDDGTMVWSPGMGYNYSNVGFCILHRIVEVVGGKDYESFLKEDVLEQMGITDTHIGGYREDRRENECVYYSQSDADSYTNPLRELAGAAGIITSTNQMMQILTHMDGDETIPDIFSYETLMEMYEPYHYSGTGTYGESYKRYGLGWRLNHPTLFEGAHYHGGNIAGTATIWAANTYNHMSGAFVCNSRAYNSNNTGDIDDNMYVLLNSFMRYFE